MRYGTMPFWSLLMQTKEQLENEHLVPDHWGYQSSEEDKKRASKILTALSIIRPGAFQRVLDIGAYEGWLTNQYPAEEKHGYEISDNAAARFPSGVTRVLKPEGRYPLITATGCLYQHYDYKHFFELFRLHSQEVVLTCNIKSWERPELSRQHFLGFTQVYTEEFHYNEHIQMLRIFKV